MDHETSLASVPIEREALAEKRRAGPSVSASNGSVQSLKGDNDVGSRETL